MPALVITICVLLIIEFRLNIFHESHDVTDVFICAKNRFMEESLQSYHNIFLICRSSLQKCCKPSLGNINVHR